MISQTDLELLNAYLDGALDESQRAELESRLASEPELRSELNSLRSTARLVRSLPTLRAPRDFTLTQADARRARTIAFPYAAISFISAAASIVLIILGVALLNPSSQLSQSPNTAAELRTLELDDTSDGSPSADAAIVSMPTASSLPSASPMPSQQPTQLPLATMSAMTGGAAAPVPFEAQENATVMSAVQDGEFSDTAATAMLEEVQVQATQIAGRTTAATNTTNTETMQDALPEPEQPPAIADLAAGMIAQATATATQTTVYGVGADAFASEVSPPGYAEPGAMYAIPETPSPAGTSFMFSREDQDQETTDALESATLITETSSPTVTPSITPSPTASETPLPTATIEPIVVSGDEGRLERQRQESEMPIGAILIGIGVVIGIFAVVYFLRARR